MEHHQEYTHEHDNDLSAKEIILLSLLGIVVVGGVIYLGRRAVKKGISRNEDRKSLDTGSAANFAKRIQIAFDNPGGFGVSEENLRKVLLEIADQEELKAVDKSYKRQTDRELMADLKNRLWPTEFEEMNAILASKPAKRGTAIPNDAKYKLWAKRLKNAFDITYWGIPGTDTDAVRSVFLEFKSQQDYRGTVKAFMDDYHLDLEKELKSELEFWEYPEFMAIISSKPNI